MDKNKSILYGTILSYTSNMRKLLAAIILNDFPFSLSFSVHPFRDQYLIPMGYTLSEKKTTKLYHSLLLKWQLKGTYFVIFILFIEHVMNL